MRQFIFFNEILSIWLSSLIHQGKRRGGTWPKLIWHGAVETRQESNFFGKQKIFARISDNKKIIQNLLDWTTRFEIQKNKEILFLLSFPLKTLNFRMNEREQRGQQEIPSVVFHLRKLKPNCSFTPSALPLEPSLRGPSVPERTQNTTSPYFFTSKI